MIGAIIGDVVGSVYEFNNIRTKDFPLLSRNSSFTDDTVLTIAVMDYFIHKDNSVTSYLVKWAKKYPNSGYGNRFNAWIYSKNHLPYRSFGNGSAMRISPVAYVARSLDEVRSLVRDVTNVTHNTYQGVKGAEVIAVLTYKALHGASKDQLRKYAIDMYPEIASFDYETLRKMYTFNETCQGSVPQAIYCFLKSVNFEDCLRTTISIGGDCDTTAAMSMAIAEAYYGVDKEIEKKVRELLPDDMISVIDEFDEKFVK